MNANIIKKANDLVNSMDVAYVAVVDGEGYPNVATRSTVQPDGIFSCYFATGTSGNMANKIMSNNKGGVCFHKAGDNISLVGDFEIIDDLDKKKELWIDWFINHFPEGPEDPGYCVIKFTTKRVSFWIDRECVEFDIASINKPQSRCGLLCDVCSFKKSHNCGGCIETNGHPFHGECPIATCCQDKDYTHCGECDVMPCKQLQDYSCGDDEHCDVPKGARLEMLKYWAR